MRAQLRLLSLALALFLIARPPVAAETEAEALDRRVLSEAGKDSELLANLTHLSDVIGPRLTGSAQLKRAGDWAAGKMKNYGLVNVHHEPWVLPEGWERGHMHARIVEPDNGVRLAMASLAWTAGTPGPVRGPVVSLDSLEPKALEKYKGKLKGAIVLSGKPVELMPLEKINESGTGRAIATASKDGNQTPRGTPDLRTARKAREEFLQQEGVTAVLSDAGKHFGLLFTTGSWDSRDRPSAIPRMPSFYVAHNHYQMLHRLANRPGAEPPVIEIDAKNRFIPGPIAVNNTIGEIAGSDKPDEVVVIGAHLDSWDLGQGTVDNGTGSTIVLETARILARSGVKPRRTIRFILFTGEEQGLKGSSAYVEKHKDELPRISACVVHDTGTGKCVGLVCAQAAAVKHLEGELGTLKSIGLTEFRVQTMSGSDHYAFEKAGVPGFYFKQEVAGYRFAHHSQADTLDRADEASLRQGAQAMAVTALRLANLDGLLRRGKEEAKTAGQ
jgi:carboxypeptidase Q